MKIAYLILAHNNPKVISRAIRCLATENSTFHIHIDKKSDTAPFTAAIDANDCVSFCNERIPVYWGEYSMVEAILLLMRQALAPRETPDYCILLSGSDFPIRSKEYIRDYLEKSRGAEFISMVRMPADGKPLSRINTVRYPSDRPVRQTMMRVLAKCGLGARDYREYLGGMEPYAGSTWWALTTDACHYLLDFVDSNRAVSDFFRNTFASDEMYFHTILGNSVFRPRIRRNIMYDDWNERGPHPEPIGEKHLAWFEARDKVIFSDMYGTGEMLFARKFSEENLQIVQRLEQIITVKG